MTLTVAAAGTARRRDGTTPSQIITACNCPYCKMMTGLAPSNATTNAAWSADTSAANGKKILTDAQAAAQLDRYHTQWNTAKVAGVTQITFSFYSNNPGSGLFSTEASGFSAFSDAQKAAARQALAEWAAVSNVQFIEVTDPSKANIKFANTTSGPAQAWTYGPGSAAQCGTVWVNPSQWSNQNSASYQGLADGGYGMLTLIHEIGHALGLAHPGDYNYTPGVATTYAKDAQYYQDSWQYSVMSYFSETNTGANYQGKYASTLLQDDIYAIQALYGTRTNERTGDTVYGFHSNAGDVAYDFSVNSKPVITLYDNGGKNTLDLSGYSTVDTVDLHQEAFSSVGGLTKNISIAAGTKIDFVIAGSGVGVSLIANDDGDTLTGGRGGDLFTSGKGNDTLIGAAANNIFYFNGVYGADVVQQNLDGGMAKLQFDVAKAKLGFTKSGSDLLIAKLGTADSVLVKNYFTNTSRFSFVGSDGAFTPTVPPPVVTTPTVTTTTKPTVTTTATTTPTTQTTAKAVTAPVVAPITTKATTPVVTTTTTTTITVTKPSVTTTTTVTLKSQTGITGSSGTSTGTTQVATGGTENLLARRH